MQRNVQAETLDDLDARDPAAVRSRLDLQRVHRVMGTRGIVVQALQTMMVQPVSATGAAVRPTSPLRVLELGAGDGTLMLHVARTLVPAWPSVELTLLDRQPLVAPATLDAFGALGWRARTLVVDVADWAATRDVAAQPSWDLIVANLFLHHFDGEALTTLLRAVAQRSRRLLACEPRRAWIALAGSHLVGALGANVVTREDAVLSVHAGFAGQELSAKWPGSVRDWRLGEYSAGLFSHCFTAQRHEVH